MLIIFICQVNYIYKYHLPLPYAIFTKNSYYLDMIAYHLVGDLTVQDVYKIHGVQYMPCIFAKKNAATG